MMMSDEWIEAKDPVTNRVYWFHSTTKQTTWNEPNKSTIQTPMTSIDSKSSIDESLKKNNEVSQWREAFDSQSGRSYYFHRGTKETSWERPKCLGSQTSTQNIAVKVTPSESQAIHHQQSSTDNTIESITLMNTNSSKSVLAQDDEFGDITMWRKHWDKKSQKTYYYNKKTKATSWKMPPGFIESQNKHSSPLTTLKQDEIDMNNQHMSSLSIEPHPDNNQSLSINHHHHHHHHHQQPHPQPHQQHNDSQRLTSMSLPSSDSQAAPSEARSHASSINSINNNGSLRSSNRHQTHIAARTDLRRMDTFDVANPITTSTSSVISPTALHRSSQSDCFMSQNSFGVASDSTRIRNLKQLLQDSDDDEHEDGSDTRLFNFSKHRHGWVNRTLRIGQIANEEQLLSFKKSLIKKALLKQNRDLDEQCVSFFKSIMSYMGDRKSSKSDVEHACKILKSSLSAPQSLKDEVYFQLCKQLTNHPRSTNALKGWELMMLLSGTYPPSKRVSSFLFDFYRKNAADSHNMRQIVQLAKRCYVRLEKIISLGVRQESPSMQEIHAIQQGKDVVLQVYLLDTSARSLFVNSFMMVREAKNQICTQLSLKYNTPFALYEISNNGGELILDDNCRLLDIPARWERIAQDNKSLTVESFHLVYKAQLVLKSTNLNVAADIQAIHLLYIQAVFDVSSSRYPLETKDIASLAAIQLQVSEGNYDVSLHNKNWIMEKLAVLVPSAVFESRKGKKSEQKCLDLSQKILSKYSKLKGVSQFEAKISYLEYVQEWPLYGATYLTVEQKQLKEYPNPILIAVTNSCVALLDPESNVILESFGFNEIVTWGFSDEKFILVIGNLLQQRKLFFRTTQGKFLNKVVNDYVQVKSDEVKTT